MADRGRPAWMGRVKTPPEPETRRAAIMHRIEADTGIDEPMIVRLVDAFHDGVPADPLLWPVFAERITDGGPGIAGANNVLLGKGETVSAADRAVAAAGLMRRPADTG